MTTFEEDLEKFFESPEDVNQIRINGRELADPRRVQVFAKKLPLAVNLIYLNIANNAMFMLDESFADAIAQCKKLELLDFTSNYIGDSGVKVLCERIFPHTENLTELNLRSNYIGIDGAKVLAENITKLTKLKKINLYNNEIVGEGRRILVEAFAKMKNTLVHIDLRNQELK